MITPDLICATTGAILPELSMTVVQVGFVYQPLLNSWSDILILSSLSCLEAKIKNSVQKLENILLKLEIMLTEYGILIPVIRLSKIIHTWRSIVMKIRNYYHGLNKIVLATFLGWGLAACSATPVATLTLALTVTLAATSTPILTPVPAGIYYTDCAATSNGNGSETAPWNNLTTISNTKFSAGSQILFKRGTTCNGQLWPKGSGVGGSPIVVDAYGAGSKPIIAGGGLESAIYLYNQEYWEIRNLEVTNHGAEPHPMGLNGEYQREGIYLVLEDYGTGSYYRLINLTVHDVNGTLSFNGDTGIKMNVKGNITPTKFNDVIMDGNTVYDVVNRGISTSSWNSWECQASLGPDCTPTSSNTYVGWTNVILRNNMVYNVTGDGIEIGNTDHALLEYNVVHHAPSGPDGTYDASLWSFNTNYTTFQYNEVYGSQTNLDGEAFDIDYGQTGTVYQYNYSHDNLGGFMLVCTYFPGGNTDGIVRYNISQDDHSRIVRLNGPVSNVKIYNNTFYVGKVQADFVVANDWEGRPESAYFYNNIFYNAGYGGYVLSPIDRGHIIFDYNLYYGFHHSTEPEDPHKITGDPLLAAPGTGGTGRLTVDGYKLLAGSAALANGLIIPNNGGHDFWNNPVPIDCPPDRGAHQFSPVQAGCTYP